jgi:hypothetical protein
MKFSSVLIMYQKGGLNREMCLRRMDRCSKLCTQYVFISEGKFSQIHMKRLSVLIILLVR